MCAGADNLQDPFNPVGRGDPLETAALMVMVGHLLPGDAYRTVSDGVRQALGLPAPAPASATSPTSWPSPRPRSVRRSPWARTGAR